MTKSSETSSAFSEPSVSPNASIFPKDKWRDAFNYMYVEDAYIQIRRDPTRIGIQVWNWHIEFIKDPNLIGLHLTGTLHESPGCAIEAAERAYKMVKREYCDA